MSVWGSIPVSMLHHSALPTWRRRESVGDGITFSFHKLKYHRCPALQGTHIYIRRADAWCSQTKYHDAAELLKSRVDRNKWWSCQTHIWCIVDVFSGVTVTWKLRHNALHKESTAAAHGRSSYAAPIREFARCELRFSPERLSSCCDAWVSRSA